MKNILFILSAVVGLIVISNIMTSKNLIPDEAIRIRIIGSTNDVADQNIKLDIKNNIEKYLYSKLINSKSISEADSVIKNELDNINQILDKYNINYTVNYGMNYFPKKEFKGINYKEGEYKSLVITLDKGLGKNWWCVLYPPLCLIDNSTSDVEYRSFVKDLISKYV